MMSYIREKSVDEDAFPAFRAMQETFGFIPNFFRAQTARPDLIDAEAQLIETLLLKEGALTRQQKEYIFLVCSAANLSTYCVTAHCEIVRMLALAGPSPEQIAMDHATADIPMVLKALLAFAAKLNTQAGKVSRRDVDALRTYGHTDEQILETVLMVGMAKFTNFVSIGLGTAPDFDPPRPTLEHIAAANK